MTAHLEPIDKRKVVLVTTTFTTTMQDPRVLLALETCREAKSAGYQLIVVDGSPCSRFKIALRETGVTVIEQTEPGMGSSRRQCLRAGLDTGAKVVVWLEPEKCPWVPLLDRCIEPVLNGPFHVVIPRRYSLASYPQYQAWSEYQANWILGNITGRPDLDFYFGPRIMDREAAHVMSTYRPDATLVQGDNWEILFLPLLEYMRRGWNIGSVTVDYVHPPEQLTEDDEKMRTKRDKQRNDLVTAMHREAQRLGIQGLK